MRSIAGVFVIGVIVAIRSGVCRSNIIDYDAPCRRHDPDLSSCLAKAFYNARKEFASGNWLPGLQMRPMDPFNLQNHVFGSDRFFKIITHNMTVNGLSNFVIDRYVVNLKDLSADITLFFPKIADTGIYSGTIGPFGVGFQGNFSSWYRNTRAFLHFEAEKHLRDGVEFLRLVDVTLGSDKKFIALKSTHRVHDIVIPMVYPYIERTYADIIKEEMNKFADLVPYDMLLPEK